MTIFRYLIAIVAISLMVSCVSDNTSLGGKPISLIEISSISETYNTEKGDILTITPTVTQSINGKELSYAWEINQTIYSNDKNLTYTCDDLGTFNARLIVTNEDGSEFFPFTINVNSPYEEGILIISNGEQGESMISFMRKEPDSGELISFVEEDCFSLNNPDTHFSAYVSDVTQSNGAVILACKGDDTAHNPSMIYYINDKTFEVENIVNTSEYPDFKPIKMHICSKGIGGTSYPILTENGEVYEFASTEGTVIKSASKLPYVYHKSTVFYDSGTGYLYSIIFWDIEKEIPLQIMTGYGPYYCINEYTEAKNRDNVNAQSNIFVGQNLVKMFQPKLSKAQMLTQSPELVIISTSKNTGMLHRTIMPVDFWTTNKNDYTVSLIINEKLKIIGFGGVSLLKEDSPVVASNQHKAAYIGDTNKLYRWYYASSNMLTAGDKPFATIGSNSSIITSVELSDNQKEVYVTAYDPAQQGKNGSFYIVDSETGEILKEYLNIAYKPIKVIYKR